MPDLSHLSDEDLQKIASGEKPDLTHISDAELEKIASQPSPEPKRKIDELETALTSGVQGLSGNFADEAIGAAAATLDPRAIGEGYFDKWGERYKNATGAVRDYEAESKKQNPYTAAGAEVAGAVASPINKINRLGGAVVSGIQAAGASEHNPLSSPQEFKDFAVDVGLGAGAGLAGTGLIKGVSSVASKFAPEALKKFAGERALKSATGQGKKVLQNIEMNKGIAETGLDLLNGAKELGIDPIVKFGMKAEEIAPAAKAAAAKAWSAVEDVYKNIDDAAQGATLSGRDVARKIIEYARKITKSRANEGVVNELIKEANYAKKLGPMSLSQAQAKKSSYEFIQNDARTHALGLNGNNTVRAAYDDVMGKEIKRRGGEDLKKIWEAGKNMYGSGSDAAKNATKEYVSGISNRFVSPSDYGVGSMVGLGSALLNGGNALPTIAATAATTVGHKIARERLGSATAVTSKRLGELIEKNPYTAHLIQRGLSNLKNTNASSGLSQLWNRKNSSSEEDQ